MKCPSYIMGIKHFMFTALKGLLSKDKMYLPLPDSLLRKINMFGCPQDQI